MATTTTTTGATNRNGTITIGNGSNSLLGNVSLGTSPNYDFGLAAPAATGNRTFKYFTHANGLVDATDIQCGIDFQPGVVSNRSDTINQFTSYRDEPRDTTNIGNLNMTIDINGMYNWYPVGDQAGTAYANYPQSITATTPATDNEATVGYGRTGGFATSFGGPTPSGNTY